MSAYYGRIVTFVMENQSHCGYIEKEYENSFLVCVDDPSPDLMEKYNNRMIVSKRSCHVEDGLASHIQK